jgi:hypothetical protein
MRKLSSHRRLRSAVAACLLASLGVAVVSAVAASATAAVDPVTQCGSNPTPLPTGAVTTTQVGSTVTVSYQGDGYAPGVTFALAFYTSENVDNVDTNGQAVADGAGHLAWSFSFRSVLTTGSGTFATYCVNADSTFLQGLQFGWGTPTGSVSATADCSTFGGDNVYTSASVAASFRSLSPNKPYHVEVTTGIPEQTGTIGGTSSSAGTLAIAGSASSDESTFTAPGTYQWMLRDGSGTIVQAGIIDMTADCARSAGTFAALRAGRVLDTRGYYSATPGPIAAGDTVVLQVDGRFGVPASGVSAVVLNVTVTVPTAAGVITVYPDGTELPPTSNVNYRAGQTLANSVVVPVGTDGKVDLHVAGSGTVQLVADVSGYYLAGETSEPGTFAPVTPTRLLDTRNGTGAAKATVAAGDTVALAVGGRAGVPASGVSAVALNVTVTGPTGAGLITAYADGKALPKASNVNYVKGQTVANLVIVPVGANGKVDLHVTGTGTVQLVADVLGYYRAGAASAPGSFVSLTPARTLDTRVGTGAAKGAVTAGHAVALMVDGRGGVPASGVSAVVLNATGSGVITVFAMGTGLPLTSNLNYVKGQTIANLVTVPVGGNGAVELYVTGSKTVQLVADVAGYYRS